MNVDSGAFWREGYLIVRELFTSEEFLRMRERVLASLHLRERENRPVVDALADPLLSEYVYDPRLINTARLLLQSEDIAYYGDGSYAVVGHNYQPGRDVGGWHRDNTDRSNVDAPDWRSRYTLIRFGFYLQDHRRTSGGLIVRRTSHDRILTGWKAHFFDRYLNNGLGDVDVWSMRIQHAGLGRCLRWLPGIALGPTLQRLLPEVIQAPFGEGERAALWISYGVDDAHLARHCDYLMTRTERVEMWQHAHYEPAVLEACGAKGLKVIDMPTRVRTALERGAPVGQHRHHYQMPY